MLKPTPNIIQECFAICLISMFIDGITFSSSSMVVVIMHVVALLAYSVASKEHLNTT